MIMKTEKIQNIAKFLLWIIVFCLVGVMTYFVFITHPIKNFRSDTLLIWIGLSLVFVPLSIFIKKGLKDKNFNMTSGDGCSNGCVGVDIFDSEILILLIIVLFAALAGLFFAIILIVIEILLQFLFEVSDFWKNNESFQYIVEGLVVSYGCYFLALTFTVLFF